MNEHRVAEIGYIISRSNASQEVKAYAAALVRWVQIVNGNSDGWPYWVAGRNAAKKLGALLERAAGLDYQRPGTHVPTTAELRRALAPIKACATAFKLPSPIAGLEDRLAGKNTAALRTWCVTVKRATTYRAVAASAEGALDAMMSGLAQEVDSETTSMTAVPFDK